MEENRTKLFKLELALLTQSTGAPEYTGCIFTER